jgi:hypothetical protein
MSRVTPQMRNFAERLISYESDGNKSAEFKTPAVFPIFEKLRPQLAALMGLGGFRALLSRSLVLAQEEVRWLRAVHVKSDGALEGLEELHAQVGQNEFSEGRVVLLAQLLGLLVAFIGEKLMLQIVRDVWPELLLKDLDFNKGRPNEKTR